MENTKQRVRIVWNQAKQDTEWLYWLLVITENLAEHQNKIKIVDSAETFSDVSTGILLLVSGLS